MKTQRIEELLAGMKSFNKAGYHKSEMLSELFALQQEIVELTFNGEHATTANLKIWDVEKHLEQLNEECGHIADDELKRFIDGSKILCNLIKAEISGNRGEYKAFKTLEYLQSKNRVIRNVELNNGEMRTEIDALVITPKCLTIVEVKNTAKNILIDEEGNYYRTGEFLKWDCNIAEKMSVKEELLRKVLADAGYGHVRTRSVVVFTNNKIEVQNKFSQIRTCFVNHLAYIIDGFKLEDSIGEDDMENIYNAVVASVSKEVYPIEFDVRKYQTDFAVLLTKLEMARAKEEEMELAIENVQDIKAINLNKKEKISSLNNIVRRVISSKPLRYVGSTAATVSVAVISGIIAVNVINKTI